MDRVALRMGLRPLTAFASSAPEEAGDADEGSAAESPGTSFPPEQWFPAEEGLATVRGLLRYLDENPAAFRDAQPNLIADLRQFEQVLSQLVARGVRWHLAVDY
jgi:hypothetical protein